MGVNRTPICDKKANLVKARDAKPRVYRSGNERSLNYDRPATETTETAKPVKAGDAKPRIYRSGDERSQYHDRPATQRK